MMTTTMMKFSFHTGTTMMLSHGPKRALFASACRKYRWKSRRLVSKAARDLSSSSEVSLVTRRTSLPATAAIAVVSLSIGFAAGRIYNPHSQQSEQVLPNGLPRTCCDQDAIKLTQEQKDLNRKLMKIVGKENVLDGRVENTKTLPFLKGARLGSGKALCIVTPRRLIEVVDCVKAIVDADCVVLPQGRNTGLTGGSVPHTNNERPTVLLSMKYLDRIFPIDDGERVVCLAGTGLASLQDFLDKYFPDRESHSVLGSTFLNPTTAAGVAFGSGGTQCRKGPAYTERALYLKVTTNKWKENVVQVVDTLGIEGMEEKNLEGRARKMDSIVYLVDTWSRWIHEGYERDMRYSRNDKDGKAPASDRDYMTRLCKEDSSVSRYNADTRGPDLNRSEGKVIILATVHDTFPKPKRTKSFWLGFDSLQTALAFRREVCLDNPQDLPISIEYMDRDAFDVIDRSGRVLGTTIKLFGTCSPVVGKMWNIKLWVEALPFQGAPQWIDKLLHFVNPIMPATLPRAIMDTGRKMDHHVAMTVGDYGEGNMDRLLDRLQKFASKNGREKIVIHECASKAEVSSLSAFRFVAAPAFRTWCVGEGVQGFSVDYALPKNGGDVPPVDEVGAKPLKRMRYSHFGCNVVHEDVAYGTDVDIHAAKHALKHTVEHECRGKLPAEHGHGTEYIAPKETQARWKKMDPLNVLNPGVGGLSEQVRYKD